MKVIVAEWEKRNLGLDCLELTVDEQDSLSEFESTIVKMQASYLVVRIPPCRMAYSSVLMRQGYTFAETMFTVTQVVECYVPREKQKMLMPRLSDRIMDDVGKKRLFQEIRAGMYQTDRISLDPEFSPKQAANRYIGMLTDEIGRGAELWEQCIDGQGLGFVCIRVRNEHEAYMPLYGVYAQFRGAGLGFVAIASSCNRMQSRGISTIESAVSSNNFASLNTLTRNGYKILKSEYVFVKHT